MLPSKSEFNHVASSFWPFSLNITSLFTRKYLSLFQNISFTILAFKFFSPTLCNTDIDIRQEKRDETNRGNSIFVLVILKNHSNFLWQNIKNYGGSLKKDGLWQPEVWCTDHYV